MAFFTGIRPSLERSGERACGHHSTLTPVARISTADTTVAGGIMHHRLLPPNQLDFTLSRTGVLLQMARAMLADVLGDHNIFHVKLLNLGSVFQRSLLSIVCLLMVRAPALTTRTPTAAVAVEMA